MFDLYKQYYISGEHNYPDTFYTEHHARPCIVAGQLFREKYNSEIPLG